MVAEGESDHPIADLKEQAKKDNWQLNEFQRRMLRQLALFLLFIGAVVGIGMGVVVYNSTVNAPKIQCIYEVSIGTNHDISHLLHNDKNPKDYTEAKCGGG